MMNRTKIVSYAGIMLVLFTIVGEMLLRMQYPNYTGRIHMFVPLFFFILYACAMSFVDMKASAREFLKKYMSFKLVKMAVSLSATILLAFVFKNQAKGIFINFLVFYLITIVFENAMVMQLKKKNNH